MTRALLQEISDLPEILNDHKEHLRECFICYNIAIQLKGKEIKTKNQLVLIGRIIERKCEVKPRLLGKDKMVYLKIPEGLWEDIKYFLAEHKKRIDPYVVTESYYQRVSSTTTTRKPRAPITKEGAEAFVQAIKEGRDGIVRVSLDEEEEYNPSVASVFKVYDSTKEEHPEIVEIKAEQRVSGLSLLDRIFGAGSSDVPADDGPEKSPDPEKTS